MNDSLAETALADAENTAPILRIAQALERIEALLRQELQPLYIRTCDTQMIKCAQNNGIDVVGDDECSVRK